MVGGEALAAGGERRLSRQRLRHLQAGHVPAHAAVVGRNHAEVLPVRRIRERETTPVVEERHAVVERSGLRVHERDRPGLAAVRGDVDPEVGRRGAERHRDGVLGVEGLDVAELQAG